MCGCALRAECLIMFWLLCSQDSQQGNGGAAIPLGCAKLPVLARNTMGKLIHFCFKGMLLEGQYEPFSLNG